MQKTNQAHTLLESIGAPVVAYPKQAHGAMNPSATKAGPGRYHAVGKTKDFKPKGGAPRGFVQHTATTAKRNRRIRIAAVGGIRQFKKLERFLALSA